MYIYICIYICIYRDRYLDVLSICIHTCTAAAIVVAVAIAICCQSSTKAPPESPLLNETYFREAIGIPFGFCAVTQKCDSSIQGIENPGVISQINWLYRVRALG